MIENLYDAGYRHGQEDEQKRQHRYAWLKLFCLIVLGGLVALYYLESYRITRMNWPDSIALFIATVSFFAFLLGAIYLTKDL